MLTTVGHIVKYHTWSDVAGQLQRPTLNITHLNCNHTTVWGTIHRECLIRSLEIVLYF